MVNHECPKYVVSMPDRPFSFLLKAGVPLSLCVHLRDKGLSLGDVVWTVDSPRLEFFPTFYWNHSKSRDCRCT